MTTIAATRKMMAADSRVIVDESSYLSPKLVVFSDAIVGAAGDTEACHLFFEWWQNRETAELVIPKGLDVEALVLTKEGLYRYGKHFQPDVIMDGVMAIGSGQAIALASMDTMIHLNIEPDPRIAVEIACKRNPGSGLPVDFMTTDQIKKVAVVKSAMQPTAKKQTAKTRRRK